MSLSLSLSKPGDAPVSKLKLNLSKGAKFFVELLWDSEEDLDAHALLATNSGSGAKVTQMTQVLSTYNAKKTNPDGVLENNADLSFSTPEGALTHSGDIKVGKPEGVEEMITIDTSKIPSTVNEIPIFVTIHPAGKTKFREVTNAGIRIKDDSGKVLGEYLLTNEFAEFDCVQMGSVELENGQWVYAPVGSGFNGDFNVILGYFS